MNFELRNIFLGLSVMVLTACEVIPENQQWIPVGMTSSDRTTLIVEFSGLACNNCPKAAETAHDLLEYYGEQLVVVEMHPASNSLTQAAKPEWDYTCPEADEYYTAWNIPSLPGGVINMAPINNAYNIAHEEWGTACMNASTISSPVTITQHVEKNTTNKLQLETTIKNLSNELQDLKYIAWVTEDSIVGPQVMPNRTTNKNYVHNHILRGAITPIWGQALQVQPADSATISLTYTLPEKVVPHNCNIVGIITKNGEAIQVNEYKLKNIK